MDKLPKRRKHHRLRGYDYSLGGIYFITLCLQHRLPLFGEIINGEMLLNPAGQMVEQVWLAMPDYNPGMVLDCHIVMPNHFHAVMGLIDPEIGRRQCTAPTGKKKAEVVTKGKPPTKMSLHDVVRRFKTLTGKEYGKGVRGSGLKPYDKQLWQRSYWDHVVRSDGDLEVHRNYVENNPLKWELDELFKLV